MAGDTQPGGKVNQVLTDTEILNAFGRWDGFYATLEAVRKVEAAVLAKVRAERDFLPRTEREAQAAYLNAKWEREARKRVLMGQREAWDACYAFITALAGRGLLGSRYDYPDKERDRRYPLPTKRVPRTVVLSDGRSVSASTDREDKGWRVVNSKGLRCFTSDDAAPFGWAKTPADARLLADLVENPYQEVPDDA